MNFKRIEWIFLVAFIVLDFFLMTTYFHQDSIVESTTNTSTQDSTASLMKSLKNDQISHGKLSDKSQSGYYLAGEDTNTCLPGVSGSAKGRFSA